MADLCLCKVDSIHKLIVHSIGNAKVIKNLYFYCTISFVTFLYSLPASQYISLGCSVCHHCTVIEYCGCGMFMFAIIDVDKHPEQSVSLTFV